MNHELSPTCLQVNNNYVRLNLRQLTLRNDLVFFIMQSIEHQGAEHGNGDNGNEPESFLKRPQVMPAYYIDNGPNPMDAGEQSTCAKHVYASLLSVPIHSNAHEQYDRSNDRKNEIGVPEIFHIHSFNGDEISPDILNT